MADVCAICGRPFLTAGSDDAKTREHILPVADGGTSRKDNITYTHERCNKLRRTLQLTRGL